MERFSALVLSQDQDTLKVINRTFEECGLEANVVRDVDDANELLKNQRFDLAVCDYDLPGAQNLSFLDPHSYWRGTVFALIRQEQMSVVSGRRVHLTLPKPLTHGVFSRGLRAAYTSMANERRSAFRCPVDVDAAYAELTNLGEQRDLGKIKILNVSRTGLCLLCKDLLPQHATVSTSFDLPDHGGLLNIEGEVVWTKAPGQSGLRFVRLPAASQKRLTAWLEAKLPQEFSALR